MANRALRGLLLDASAVTEGPILHFVRQRLIARSREIGWKPSRDGEKAPSARPRLRAVT